MRTALAILLASLAVAGRARAEDATARARESFRQAEAALQRRDFATAAAGFEQAASFQPHPSSLLNAADAWAAAGDPVRAIVDCDRAAALPDLEPSFAAAARACLDRLGPKVATLDLTGPPTTSARVDGGPEVRAPARQRFARGRHRVVVTDLETGATRTLDLDLAPGEVRRLDAEPPPRAPEPPPPAPVAPPRSAGPPLGAWISFGVAGAAAGVATAFGLVTLSVQSDYDATPTTDLRSAFHRDKAITNVAWIVAGAAAAAGVVVWVTAPRPSGALGLAPGGVLGLF